MAAGQEDGGQEKIFDPTPHRLAQARERGDVARSFDASAAAAYLGLLAALVALGAGTARGFAEAAAPFFGAADRLEGRLLGPGGLGLSLATIGPMLLASAPLFMLPAGAALAALVAQQAFAASASKLAPQWSRVSPVATFGRKFGPTGLVEFAKATAKMTLIGLAVWWWVAADVEQLVGYARLGGRALAREIGETLVSLLGVVAAIAVAIAAADLAWQRFDHERRLRMSLEEIRQEAKETEGDPFVRRARRGRAEAIATNRMLAEVPKADVVIVNPTHYAVALAWSRRRGAAPRCVAKGVDEVAAQIRARAAAAGVPIHRDPPTARALHATVRIGREIAPEHYRAVAAAIRFAEDMRRRARARGRTGGRS
jgi:flagellar biosynthetic protein FlhB